MSVKPLDSRDLPGGTRRDLPPVAKLADRSDIVSTPPPTIPSYLKTGNGKKESPNDVQKVPNVLGLGNPPAAGSGQSKKEKRSGSLSVRLASPMNGDKTRALPWQKMRRHRKSQSLTTPSTTLKGLYKSDESVHESTGKSDMSPMLRELWNIQKDSDAASATHNITDVLSIPNLAKPLATSFLTGTDSHRTSAGDYTEWQVALPSKSEFETCLKVGQFLDTYRSKDCILDLEDLIGVSKLELNQFARGNYSPALTGRVSDCHRPTVENLMECGNIHEVKHHNIIAANEEGCHGRETLILEQDRQFLCVFRGMEDEQQGKHAARFTETAKMMANGKEEVTVLKYYRDALQQVATTVFDRLNALVDENPFYDVCFSGHSFGAGMALLAGYRYALARPDLRVSVLVSGTPKIGREDFCQSTNSIGNLRVFRLEHSQFRNLPLHAGHTIRLNPLKQTVDAYLFGQGYHPHYTPFKKNRSSCSSYVSALETVNAWVAAFYKHDGAGIRGTNDEVRNVV